MQITVYDQIIGGPVTHQTVLEFLTEEMTLRDLIKSRVYQEVKDANAKLNSSSSSGPVFYLTETEKALNERAQTKHPRNVDFQEQYDKAIDAFHMSRYFVLVDDFQPRQLDDTIVIKPDTKINFVKLVYLTGG